MTITRWSHLRAAVTALVPEIDATFRGPASEAQLQAAEREFGFPLPEILREVYRDTDGQPWGVLTGCLIGMRLLPLEESLTVVRGVRDFYSEMPEFAGDIVSGSLPPDAVQGVGSHPRWWPFAMDGGGGTLCVDFAPGPAGRMGQVMGSGDGRLNTVVVAWTVAGFFGWYGEQLQANVVVNRLPSGEPHLELRHPQRPFFLDSLPHLVKAGELPRA